MEYASKFCLWGIRDRPGAQAAFGAYVGSGQCLFSGAVALLVVSQEAGRLMAQRPWLSARVRAAGADTVRE